MLQLRYNKSYIKIFLLTDVKNNNTAHLSYTNCSLNTEDGGR